MRRTPNPRRSVRFTLLIVGEGDSETEVLRHLKHVFGTDAGRFTQVRNAHGKGAHNVLLYAARCQRATPHDRVVIWVDDDAHWDDKDRASAAAKGVKVVESSPCLEAVLLAIHGKVFEGETADFKKVFKEIFGCEAHEVGYLSKYFGREVLDRARGRVPQLHDILNHMGVPSGKPERAVE